MVLITKKKFEDVITNLALKLETGVSKNEKLLLDNYEDICLKNEKLYDSLKQQNEKLYDSLKQQNETIKLLYNSIEKHKDFENFLALKIDALIETLNCIKKTNAQDYQVSNDTYNKVCDFFKVGVKHDKLQFKKLETISDTLVETNRFTRLIHGNTTSAEDLYSGERQVARHISDVRKDHTARYYFAADLLEDSRIVLDAACGVGYGSYIMASKNKHTKFDAVDISRTAIAHAKTYFDNENITHHVTNILDYQSEQTYDSVVSFETIEHLEADSQLIKRFYELLKPKGKLIASVPNQEVMPFSKEKFLFHHRHYTPSEFTDLLSSNGFSVKNIYYQKDKFDDQVTEAETGAFIICVATKL